MIKKLLATCTAGALMAIAALPAGACFGGCGFGLPLWGIGGFGPSFWGGLGWPWWGGLGCGCW